MNRQPITRLADEQGNRLVTAAMALETLACLMGFDGGEHHLSDKQAYGLTCAVAAIGELVRDAGFKLCEAAELEAEQ